MRFAQSGPNGYVVVGENGRVVDAGTAASVFVWRGATCVPAAVPCGTEGEGACAQEDSNEEKPQCVS